jgi:hypothetical protein
MDALEPINGVSLEQYAKLCALMTDTKPEDTDKHAEIAQQNGVNKEDWEAAKTGWTERMQMPEYALEIQKVFMPAYQNAQAEARGGKEPCSIEDFARIKAAMSLKKDDATGEKIDFNKILEEEGYTVTKWGEVEGYWTPRIADPDDPRTGQFFNAEDATKFRELYQKESDKIAGIER